MTLVELMFVITFHLLAASRQMFRMDDFTLELGVILQCVPSSFLSLCKPLHNYIFTFVPLSIFWLCPERWYRWLPIRNSSHLYRTWPVSSWDRCGKGLAKSVLANF